MSEIAAERVEFLKTVHNIRSSGDNRSIFYLDET
jgi:hypothetical protein